MNVSYRVFYRVVVPARAVKFAPVSVRFMGGHSAAPTGDIVVPELHDTLEWVLSSPPNVHQFEEPPVSLFSFLFTRLYISLYD